ncbi:hypothetical protein [Anthocerotibacter panamensis]|uniref:hypothetical protein n=1 Tax=Anthocerotibacter panamensis TaxID=2857077 RepID=UPI001C40733D|nr:hypothetical protein [Anthocerotibacter panamensis]
MTEQEILRLIASNAQAIQVNTQGMAELRALTTSNAQGIAELRQQTAANVQGIEALTRRIDGLTSLVADLREGQAMLVQSFREEQDRREEMRRDMSSMQSQVLGLQTQANRIIERMDRRDRGENA